MTSHQLHQPRTDGQSQPRSLVLSRGRHVDLRKGFKDLVELILRNADPRITHLEVQHHPLRIGRLATDLQHDLAAVSELRGISNQVYHHLRQARWIAQQHVGNIRMDPTGQLDPFSLGSNRQRLHRVANPGAQAEWQPVQIQLAGLDLREIQNVVDQCQQRLPRFPHHVQVLTLGIGQFGVEHEISHADHGIHGGTDFMAHVGQEVAFGPVGDFRRLLGLLQIAEQHRVRLLQSHSHKSPVDQIARHDLQVVSQYVGPAGDLAIGRKRQFGGDRQDDRRGQKPEDLGIKLLSMHNQQAQRDQ